MMRLTSAVREPPVACGTCAAVSTNHIWPTVALAAERLAGIALRSDLVAAARQGAVIKERRQRHSRSEAEGRGGRRTVGEERTIFYGEPTSTELLVLTVPATDLMAKLFWPQLLMKS